jgi:predicted glycosyl hydrolase (DUF1957 family)
MMITWINFLHFYQPANTDFYNIRKALDKSYWRLLRLMEEHSELKMTINISGCLLERLLEAKEQSFIDRLKFLVASGRVELTGSAFYHGFLPLLSAREVERQIKENEKILKKIFGKKFKPKGFFLPEMAYSPAVAKIIKSLGYRWIILDEIAYSGGTQKKPGTSIYIDEASGLKVIFRDRDFSSTYPPDKLIELFRAGLKDKKQVEAEIKISATDAELYGLRHEDPTGEIEKIVKNKSLKTLTLSEFIGSLPRQKNEIIKIWPSSWESTAHEVKAGEAYNLWQSKKNKIQINLWRLANLSLALEDKYKKDKNYYWYRWHLARGLASCTFWWASAHDFSKIFGPYAWSPDDIERGLEDLIRSVRSLNNPRTKKKKIEAEKYYIKIKKLIWDKHWKKHWKKQYE